MINSLFSSYRSLATYTNANTQKAATKQENSTSNEVLGYKVDKDGYFTSDFNKTAGIPEDIKIHSSTMESLVKVATNMEGRLSRSFESIDIAKTVGNAYKILSQVVGEDILNSKDSFTLEEIANFPQGYEYHRQTMEVTKIHNTSLDYINADLGFDYQNNEDILINELFFNTTESRFKNNPATNIFNNNNGGKENTFTGVFFNTTADKYTNADGSITKGGLLIAVINSNIYTKEGETTEDGKKQGFDKSMNIAELKQARTLTLRFDKNDPSHRLYGIGEINPNTQEEWEEMLRNYKDPIASTFEEMEKFQKELLEHLEKQRQEKRVENQRKKLDIKA